jgi:hypothetical protein
MGEDMITLERKSNGWVVLKGESLFYVLTAVQYEELKEAIKKLEEK